MPMRMGELMVVIRAQDFASRTLRRVGGEFAHMSQKEMIAAKRADLAFSKQRALDNIRSLEKVGQQLRFVDSRNKLLAREATLTNAVAAAERQLDIARGARGRALSDAMNMVRIREHDLRVAKEVRKTASRKIVSPAMRVENIRQAERALAHSQATLDRVGTSSLQYGQRVAEAERHLKGLEGRLGGVRTALGRYDQAIRGLPLTVQRAAMSVQGLDYALDRNNRRLRDAYQALDVATRRQLAFEHAVRMMPVERMHEFGRAVSGIGRTMQLFGAVGTAAFGLTAHAAATFSQATSLAATQVTRIGAGTNEAIANAAKLRKEILKLADDYPFAAQEMSEATYEIFSSTNVQNIRQGIALLEAFARVGVAGQVDIQTATKASITVLNTFRGATDDVGATLNRMFSIVRFGRMRFADFADMLPKVAAAAYGSGQTLDDVAGIMAFLTRKTGDAGIAATQISRAFDVLGRKEFRVGIEKLGVSIEDVHGRLLPLPEVLGKIMDRWGDELRSGGKGAERFIQIVTRASEQAGKGFLSTAEARRFFRFVFANFDEYLDLQDKTVRNNAEFKRSFETMMADPGVQWQIFLARMRAVIIAIGQEAIPVFASLGRHVASLMDKWDSINEKTRGMIVRWGVWISVGTLLAGVLLSIAGAFISIGLTLGSLVAKLVRVFAAFFGLSQLLGGKGTAGLIGRLFLFLKMLSFLAAIGTIVIGIKLEQKGGGWDFIGKILQVGGAERALKKAGLFAAKGARGIAGRTPIAAMLVELIWPDSATRDAASDFLAKIDDLDAAAAKGMNKATFAKIKKQASMVFTMAAQEGAGFEEARRNTIAFLKSVGVSMKDTGDKAQSNTERWEQWMKQLKSSEFQGVLKALGLKDVNQELAQFDDAMDQAKEQLDSWNTQLAAETTRARIQAVDNLRQMYSEMQQVNQEAFGDLFQGPWLTSETFDLAKEWGITPRLQDMIRDLREQNQRFAQWRQSLDKLFKKGLPREFIDELRAIGPEEGQALVDNILKGKPGQVNNLISEWKRKNAQIKAATKMDFTQEIKQFQKAGGDMGRAIIEGFRNVGVGPWFDNWVKSTFPGVIDAAVNTAIEDWKKQNPRPVVSTPPTPNTNQFRQGAGGNQTNTDNSKRIEQNITLKSDAHDRSGREAEARKLAFMMVNAAKGIW